MYRLGSHRFVALYVSNDSLKNRTRENINMSAERTNLGIATYRLSPDREEYDILQKETLSTRALLTGKRGVRKVSCSKVVDTHPTNAFYCCRCPWK